MMLRRILVVEDEDVLRELLTEELRDHGYEIVAVDSLSDAIAAATSQPIHLALLDLSLPDGEGIGSLEMFASAHPDIPIMVLTGLPTDPKLQEAAMTRGAVEFLSKMKPFENVIMRIDRFFRDRAK
jgi:DNA-binding response OmpR family regulator